MINNLIDILKYLNVKKLLHKHFKFVFTCLVITFGAVSLYYLKTIKDDTAKIKENSNSYPAPAKADFITTGFKSKIKNIIDKSAYKELTFISFVQLNEMNDGVNFTFNANLKIMFGYVDNEFKEDLHLRNKKIYNIPYSKEVSDFIRNVANSHGKVHTFETLQLLITNDEINTINSFIAPHIDKEGNKYCGNFKVKITSMIGGVITDVKDGNKPIFLVLLSFAEPIKVSNYNALKDFCHSDKIAVEHGYKSYLGSQNNWREKFKGELEALVKQFNASVN